MAVKKRRITEKDWDLVAEHITKQLKNRKTAEKRKMHEKRWKEVDRQVYMEPVKRIPNNPNAENDWRSAMELGELSRASEILSADIRRFIFPTNKAWFDVHAEIDPLLDDTNGDQLIDIKEQKRIDNQTRAMMVQQHKDFGLKGRQDLSVKEALHHGGYVVEVEEETMLGSTPEGKIKELKAPVWIPHSMWNCYPDPTVCTKANNLFYPGAMIIVDTKQVTEIKAMTGKGWIPKQLARLETPGNNKDSEMIKWFGDITIPRKGDEIYLPNVKIIVVDKKVVFYKPNELPFSCIIYNGYERLDVRDPYYISPLVKLSPTQKLASTMSNKLIDALDVAIEPPVVYDKNDPEMAANGGPDMSPQGKTGSSNPSGVNVLQVGDPQAALAGVQFFLSELQKGTGVDSVRSGLTSGTEQTATEVERTRQGGQVRTVDFADKHELHGLRPFLYLQHTLNKKNLKNYGFYNPEMDAPDFERMGTKDLPENIYFDVVGSKGLLEENERQIKTMAVTKFALEAGVKINTEEVIKEMYQDAGNKNPERFLQSNEEFKMPPEMEAQIKQMMQDAQQQIQELADENLKLKMQEDSRIADSQQKADHEELKSKNDKEKIDAEAELSEKKLEDQKELTRYKIDKELEMEKRKLQMQLRTNKQELSGADDDQEDMFDKEDRERAEIKEETEAIKSETEEIKTAIESIEEEQKSREQERKQHNKAIVTYLRTKNNPKLDKVLDEIEG